MSHDQLSRKAAIDALSGAPPATLARLWQGLGITPEYRLVRGPETGLVMIRGRAGGGGNPFNLGEATVTRATVRLATGEIGHSYALGRDGEKAVRAALLDALWQREPERIEAEVLEPLRAAAAEADGQRRAETAATRVNFFTMVRGDD
ncbi:MAG: phosphonate C-P lyase system protein PhnG [Hyphomicrobiales bacterium]|nr:MAG: phosphonate C-P lyase system protein PhnG [Hyphomicrobiales bacterium]